MRIIIAGTENILWNLYDGNQRSMLITNCIFRLGAVALMLSNHPADRKMPSTSCSTWSALTWAPTTRHTSRSLGCYRPSFKISRHPFLS